VIADPEERLSVRSQVAPCADGAEPRTADFCISHHRSGANAENGAILSERKLSFGADRDEFALNADVRELPLIHADTHLNDLLLNMSQLRTRVEERDLVVASAWKGGYGRCCSESGNEQEDAGAKAFGRGIELL